jgi:hypothetical protein
MNKFDKNIEECKLFYQTIRAEPSEKKMRKISHIYWCYMKWCVLNERDTLSREAFGRATNSLYKRHKTNGHEAFYYVDAELLNLKYEDKVAIKGEFIDVFKVVKKNKEAKQALPKKP